MAIRGLDHVKSNKQLYLSLIGILLIVVVMAKVRPTDVSNYLPGIGNGGTIIDSPTKRYSSAPSMALKSGVDYTARVVTSEGTFVIDLFEDETPATVNNFVFLAEDNFYDGTTFHYIEKGKLIQGGDPKGDGSGGPGYVFDDEIVDGLEFKRYMVAMANDPVKGDANGSQFFITTRGFRDASLDGKYTIFGEVIQGTAVVDDIEDSANGAVKVSNVEIMED